MVDKRYEKERKMIDVENMTDEIEMVTYRLKDMLQMRIDLENDLRSIEKKYHDWREYKMYLESKLAMANKKEL